MPDMALQEESKFFQEHVDEWFKNEDRANKWALIKGRELIGVFDTLNEAVKAGFKRFGLEPWFTAEINPEANRLVTTGLMLQQCLNAN